jgi:hypothetical protein
MNFWKLWPVRAMGLLAATSLQGDIVEDARVFELEAFIVEETARTQTETLSPLTMSVAGFGLGGRSLLEIPRAVSSLSPEVMALLDIQSAEDLTRFGAGTQRVNYFGLAGSSFLRGARTGTYFNGMLRAYQRNEMPMGFGALEGIDLIRGPVPAGFSPTLVGGALNQRPKQPYFDTARGSVALRLGSHNEQRLTFDTGGPFLMGDAPAAYRVSATIHRADRFYENVPNDFDSLYVVLKTKLSPRHRLTVGGEIYSYRSSEIPGINRPTRELIDQGEYVIGEPVPLVSSEWGGNVIRPLVEFPFTLVVNPRLHALSIPGPTARGLLDPALLELMIDLNDPLQLEQLYSVRPLGEIPPFARDWVSETERLLASAGRSPQDAYLYTPEFFAAGGEALTVRLPQERVLADPADKADALNLIAFADLETRLSGDAVLLWRGFFEYLDTDKVSTYGFAMDTRQWIGHLRGEWQEETLPGRLRLVAGVDLRFNRARMLQDFDAEPFSRRDLSRAGISNNTVVAAGGALAPDGLNLWSRFGNASQESDLWQMATYASSEIFVTDTFILDLAFRLENAFWETGLPAEVDRATASEFAARADSGNTVLWQVQVNPRWEVRPGLVLYAAAQAGKAVAPGDGGTIVGEGSFTNTELIEGGIKLGHPDGRLFATLSVYHWDQASFSSRDAAARPLRGKGLEIETTWAVTESLTLLGAFTAQRVILRADLLGFGALPQDAEGWALNGGILNADEGRPAPGNPEMVFAGYPEVSASGTLVYDLGAGWQSSLSAVWRDSYYHDMERSLRLPGSMVWATQLRYEVERWWLSLQVDNLFDTDYWIGQEPVFSAGTLILQGTGRTVHVTAGWRF